jgi:hypothetical protein
MSCHDEHIKIASIDVSNRSVLDILCKSCRDARFEGWWTTIGVGLVDVERRCEQLATTADALEAKCLPKFVDQTHVTMAHMSRCSQQTLRNLFEPFVGKKVLVKAMALLWSDRVAALAVDIPQQNNAATDEPILPACQNAFPHITVWKACEAEAKESNDLPNLVEIGLATRVDFDESALLEGTVSLWRDA